MYLLVGVFTALKAPTVERWSYLESIKKDLLFHGVQKQNIIETNLFHYSRSLSGSSEGITVDAEANEKREKERDRCGTEMNK